MFLINKYKIFQEQHPTTLCYVKQPDLTLFLNTLLGGDMLWRYVLALADFSHGGNTISQVMMDT